MIPSRILIVEDEVIVANDIKETLNSLGYTVVGIANSGETALQKVAEVHPDLVLMDIYLGGKMDGVQTAGELHKVSDIPIIYLTAFSDEALLARAKLTEPYGYIIKPYSERELHSVIEMARYKYAMDKKLKESEDRLQKLNDELETRVAARTTTLRQQLQFLQQLIDTIPAPVYYKDSKGGYLGCNNAFEAYTGIPKREMVKKTDAALFSSDIAVLSEEKDSQLMNGKGIQVYPAKFLHADHHLRDVIFNKATFNDPDGSIAGFIGVMIDITEQKKAEEDLQMSLHEKELLLKEIHHRVKNNLQTISSFLYLQLLTCDNEQTKNLFNDARSQVNAMGLIHQKLYQSTDISRILFTDYITSLIEYLKESYGVDDTKVRIIISVKPTNLALDIDTGIPCGLIINELVTNALKYAFQDRSGGTITIQMVQDELHHNLLSVSDDGRGIPTGFDLITNKSLGMKIVSSLTRQLEGTLKIVHQPGTTIIIRFPEQATHKNTILEITKKPAADDELNIDEKIKRIRAHYG
ncbi:MAG: histidine kinase dimerization/phosphoacceptor domain -containing protein [Methanoregula sp.]